MVSQIEVKTLATPKYSASNIIFMLAGGFFLVTGVLFMISLILFIPGIFGALIGFLLMYAGVPKATTDCLACGQPVRVRSGSSSGECDHCKTANPVVWTKRAK